MYFPRAGKQPIKYKIRYGENNMHGEAKLLLKFLDGSDNRYIIPVYQRNYDWRPKQCEKEL